MVELTDETVDEFLSENELVVVDVWADWCNPCKKVFPVLANLSKEWLGVRFAKIDAMENPAFLEKHKINSLPTVLFIAHNTVVGVLVGARPQMEYADMMGDVFE